MTPGERADRALKPLDPLPPSWSYLRERVTTAINEALAEERRFCVVTVDLTSNVLDDSLTSREVIMETKERIKVAILARGQ